MSYLYVELCVAQVGVVCEGLVDECGQLRVGKYVFPQEVAECRAVGGLLTGLYIRLCESRVGRRLVFFVYVASLHRRYGYDCYEDAGYFVDFHIRKFNDWSRSGADSALLSPRVIFLLT